MMNKPKLPGENELRHIVLRAVAIFNEETGIDLVLKGGSALEMFYDHPRHSKDMDFSLSTSNIDWNKYEKRFIEILEEELSTEEYTIFHRQLKVSDRIPELGKIYRITFKITTIKIFQEYLNKKTRNRSSISDRLGRNTTAYATIHIDISDKEYTAPAVFKEFLPFYKIKVYTPVMIISEKLRAICQNTSWYLQRYKMEPRISRARDFYDIYQIQEKYSPSWKNKMNLEIIRKIFKVKEVDISLLGYIHLTEVYKINYTDRMWSYQGLRNTVEGDLRDFDFYYKYVSTLAQEILDNISSISDQTEDPS